MICRPKYNVIYRGEFYPAGSDFEISANDAEEMAVHGTIEERDINPGKPEEQKRKAGRPRKAE